MVFEHNSDTCEHNELKRLSINAVNVDVTLQMSNKHAQKQHKTKQKQREKRTT